MVYLINKNKDTLLKAPLTKGMRLDIAVTNPFPCSAELFNYRRIMTVLLVVLLHQLTVLFAISAVRQIRTSGVSTGLFRPHVLLVHNEMTCS